MYMVIKYDYTSGYSNCIFTDSYQNCINALEDIAHNEIILNNGYSEKTYNYNKLVYEYNKYPDRKRKELVNEYFIQKDEYNPDKIYVKQSIKKYGYIYNTYQIINKISLEVVYLNKINIEPYYNDQYIKNIEIIEELNNKFNPIEKSEPINIKPNVIYNKNDFN